MFRALRKIWHRTRAAGQALAGREPTAPITLRRWAGSRTDRLNQAHWEYADQAIPINQDLATYLAGTRARCIYEASDNPIVAGVIDTHATDLIGRDGPGLQIQSEDKAYNESLESLWATWWQDPELNHQLSGVDLLHAAVWMWWTCGETLWQLAKDDRADKITFSLRDIHPRRIESPIDAAGNPDVVLGVRLTPTGRPVEYYVTKETLDGTQWTIGDSETIRAGDALHAFRRLEPDQVRGIPWMASALQPIGDMRDYDRQVLDAARQAADNAVLLYSDHPDAPYFSANESTTVERRTISTLPPGWRAYQMTPQQPSAEYVGYRAERMRDLGRAVSMPLMTVLLDARQHNYSSARFDGQVYARSLEKIQGWMERTILNRLVERVASDGRLQGLATRPAKIRYVWTWPKRPHVDPVKEAEGTIKRIRSLILAPSDAVAADGMTWETHLATLKRNDEELRASIGMGLLDLIQLTEQGPVETKDQDVDEEPEEKAAPAKNRATNGNGRAPFVRA